jgi:hypothetical protein
MSHRFAGIVAVVIALAACGTTTPTSPTSPGLTLVSAGNPFVTPSPTPGAPPIPPTPAVTPAWLLGTWSGVMNDPVSGNATLQLSFGEPTPTGQPGTWFAAFANGERLSGVAVIGLGLGGDGMMLYAAEPELCGGERSPVAIALMNVVVASNRLTAVTGRFTCTALRFGSASLTKQ